MIVKKKISEFKKAFKPVVDLGKPLLLGVAIVGLEISCLAPHTNECLIHCGDHSHAEIQGPIDARSSRMTSATTLASGTLYNLPDNVQIKL